MRESVLKRKSYAFAIRIVKLCQSLTTSGEYVLSRQVLRSGTAIGAMIREAEFGQSKTDFVYKMTVALKEANETEYWLLLLNDTGYFSDKHTFDAMQSDCKELIAMLVATVKTVRKKGEQLSEK